MVGADCEGLAEALVVFAGVSPSVEEGLPPDLVSEPQAVSRIRKATAVARMRAS